MHIIKIITVSFLVSCFTVAQISATEVVLKGEYNEQI